MDCEKFESTLIDELYDELDDLTSAEAKRHASSCSRCNGLLAGLRATRKLAILPMVMPPSDMEEKILAAARDAQRVVPFKSRLQRGMSWAGSWAMRPQTAMAAVFLLAIGSSFVFMRSRSDMTPASVKVRAEGAPVTLAPSASPTTSPLDPKAAFGAHGTEEKNELRSQNQSLDLPAQKAAGTNGVDDLLLDGKLGNSALAKDKSDLDDTTRLSNASAPAGAPPPMATAATEAQIFGGSGSSGPATAKPISGASVDFPTAMNAYRARRFDEATRDFDGLASSDPAAALWAARSLREAHGCGGAVARFDAVTTRAFGTTNAYEATLDAGRCYRDLGNFALARARFASLLGVPAYTERAQDELDLMTPQTKKSPTVRAVNPAPAATPRASSADSY